MGLALPTRRRIGAVLLVTSVVAGTTLATTGALAAPVVRGQAANTVEATAANTFTPARLEVKVGTTVTWTNPQSGFHTVTGGTPAAKDTSTINGPLSFKEYKVTFDKAGTYPYYCEPHAPTMAGEIVVTAAGAPAATASASPSGPSSPTAGPSESSPAGSSQTPRPVEGEGDGSGDGDHAEDDDHTVPGIKDNEVLKRIKAEEASNNQKIKGFQTLLWGFLAAILALSIALFLSTRPRRAR